MGYYTQQVDVTLAKIKTIGWTVFEASSQKYFDGWSWRRQVVRADIKEGGQVMFFTLANGDFVSVEKREA